MGKTSNIITSLYIFSPELQSNLILLKAFLVVISVLFFSFIIFALFKTKWLELYIVYDFVEFFTKKTYGAKKAARTWKRIERRMDRFGENDYRKSIIKCQKVLDVIAKRLIPVYRATDFKKRLAFIGEETLPNVKKVWEAYDVYEKILHNPHHKITAEEGKEILETYKNSFEALEVF